MRINIPENMKRTVHRDQHWEIRRKKWKSWSLSTNQKIVPKQCQTCHDFSTNLKIKIGPPLWGLVDREVGVIKDYKYSDSLSQFNRNWTRSELFFFLKNPKEYIIGTKMVYKGLEKESDRVNLISFLESLKWLKLMSFWISPILSQIKVGKF